MNIQDLTPEQVAAFLKEQHFTHHRQLEDGSWIGVHRLITTWAVFMDIDLVTTFRYRWCFRDPAEALYFFETAKDFDEIPEVRNSLVGHRYVTAPLLVEYDELGYKKW